MKNQYFGDNRDLFKYDLIEFILNNNKHRSINGFTYIPMLTKNKGNDGNKTHNPTAGKYNKILRKFLEKCRDANRRNIVEIKTYFDLNHNVQVAIYGENKKNEYFSRKNRAEYFENIGDTFLSNPLIFVDPDNGLQVTWSNEKHLLYSEVRSLYEGMNEKSILMIYQHFPRARNKYKDYLPEGRSKRLEEEMNDRPMYISDNEIIFFFLTKNRTMKDQLAKDITLYKKLYNLDIGNVNLTGS